MMGGSDRDPWEALIDPGAIAVHDHRDARPVVVVAGAVGGAGASTIASGYALAVAAAGPPVALMDLDLDRGGLSPAWGIPVGRTIDDLAAVADDPRPEHLEMVAFTHRSGVHVYAAPGRLGAECVWRDSRLERLIDLAGSAGEVVVDAGTLRGDIGRQLVRVAGRLLIVVPPTLAACRAAQRLISDCADERPALGVEVILNRGVGTNQLATRSCARLLGRPVHVELPRADDESADCGAGREIRKRRSQFRTRMASLTGTGAG